MVEIKQYLMLLRKWAWALVLGAILGGIAGYLYSLYQPVLYQTSTKIMVSRALQQNTGVSMYNEVYLAETYAQLVTTEPMIQKLQERLDYPVEKGQVSSRQIQDSLLIEVSVVDGNPVRAAQIANTLAEVFVDYNDSLQADRYQSSEDSLLGQIAKVQEQIDSLRNDMTQANAQTLETQKQQVEDRIKEIEAQIATSEDEIIKLQKDIEGFFPQPLVTNTAVPLWMRPTPTPAPVPTSTLSPADEVAYKEAQLRLNQMEDLRELYKKAYGELLVMTTDNQSNDTAQRTEQIRATIALYQQIYTSLQSNYENVRLERLRSTPNVTQVEPAGVPDYPIQPRPVRNILMMGVAGLIIVAGIAFTVEILDDTLKTPEDVTHYLHVPVIGLIGEMDRPKRKRRNEKAKPGVFVADNPLSPITEAFRSLRTNLDFAGVDKPLRTLLVTSSGPSEGKSTVSVNLAAVMAQGDRKVILLDTDLRRPSIHRYMNLPNRKGLSDLFRDQTKLSSVIATWGNPPMAVITSGGLPPNPTELLQSERMEKILAELKDKSDIVIADSPPSIIADPIALSKKVDGVLLVVEPGKTKIGTAQVMIEQLNRAGARVLGVVMNPITRKRTQYYSKHYYTSYYYYSRGYNRYFSNNGKKGNGKSGESKRQQKESEEQPRASSD
jgi:succinoglycan biosynthesis transport protein ExoP